MSYMPDPKAKPASTDPKRGKYVAKPAPKPVYAGVHVGKPKPPVSEAINSPFTRDAYPALTDAILGVVNGQPRTVEEAVTPAQRKVFNAERERMMTALNNPNKKLSPTEREAVLARGQRNAAAEVRKDAVSPTGVKSPVHAQAKAYHEYARKESKKMDAIAKRKSVKEDFQTPERAREMSALKKKLKHEADRDSAAAWRAGEMGTADEADAAHNKAADSAFRQMRAHTTDAKEREDRKKVYGKGGKVVASGVKLKSKSGGKVVRESQELDERIIDGVDAFQAAKNWLKGKGFKTNREVSYAKVQKNYEAMKKRQAEEAKKNK